MQSEEDESAPFNNNIYRMLPEARPLHSRSVIEAISKFGFIGSPAPINNNNCQLEPDELLEIVEEGRNNQIHEIGDNLQQLFRSHVYQSYAELEAEQDNRLFATVSLTSESNETLKPVKIEQLPDTSLIFQSRFESGNLAYVSISQQNLNQYFLALQRDTNSKATSQWYYFYIENRTNLGTYTFSIVNLTKNYSAYQNGMKPCVCSVEKGSTWRRDGFNISYRRNSVPYRGDRNYYTFQFSYNFQHVNDRVYFAYSYPYTFSKLQNFLLEIETNYPTLVQNKILAKTQIGNPVNLISITNPNNMPQTSPKINKQMIIISARVHPGETNSSFVCESLIQFLLSDQEEAVNLRKWYIIKIVPFLNPDGVIHGNYRTSLCGQDLNRRWKRPEKDQHPQIYYLKKYLSGTRYNKVLYIDLHGHSKKKSTFMYGCLNKNNPYLSKQLPFILSKSSDNFCYFNCNFSTPVSRQGTSRLCIWKQFGIDYSYTMEMSFCGNVRSKVHYKVQDYFNIGRELAKVLSVYFCGKKGKTNLSVEEDLKQFYLDPTILTYGDEQSEGSESGEEDTIRALSPVEKLQKKQEKVVGQPIMAPITTKQSSKDLKGILTKYVAESKIKWTTKRQNIRSIHSKKQQDSRFEQSIRNRKNLAPSHFAIQKIDLSEQLNSSQLHTTKQKIKINSKQLTSFVSTNFYKESLKTYTNRMTYRPYSLSKSKINTKSPSEISFLLPKVLRQQSNRVFSRSRNQIKFDLSLCYEEPTRLSSRLSYHASSREIDPVEVTYNSSTQKQLHENSRYWSRPN